MCDRRDGADMRELQHPHHGPRAREGRDFLLLRALRREGRRHWTARPHRRGGMSLTSAGAAAVMLALIYGAAGVRPNHIPTSAARATSVRNPFTAIKSHAGMRDTSTRGGGTPGSRWRQTPEPNRTRWTRTT